jgi:hypothetical protein
MDACAVAAPVAPGVAPPIEGLRATAAVGPDDPVDLARDARPFRTNPRAAKLVVTEIHGLELLLSRASNANTDEPNVNERLLVTRRLAADYAELAFAVSRGTDASMMSKRDEAIRMAERYYANFLVEDAMAREAGEPEQGGLDDIEYYLAYESERAGDRSNARRIYRSLTASYPDSPFAALAHFGLGELSRADAAQDMSALTVAEREYGEAAAVLKAHNRVYGWALVRLAELASQKGDMKTAKTRYASAALFAKGRPRHPTSAGVAAAIPSWVDPETAKTDAPRDEPTDSPSPTGANP